MMNKKTNKAENVVENILIDPSKNYILFRDDIKAPDGVKTVQMSVDLLKICGEILEKKGKLGSDATWFWKSIDPSYIRIKHWTNKM